MLLTKKRALTGLLAVLFLVGALAVGCAPKEGGQASDATNVLSADGSATNKQDSGSDAPVVVVEWSPKSNCTTCHATEDASLSDNTTAAGFHEGEGLDCMDCHEDEAGLAKVHDGVTTDKKPAKNLKKTKVTTETCTASGCHADDSVRIAATADFQGIKDNNGTVKNPHDLPTGEGHKSLTCSTCHQGHKSFVADEAVDECFKCHHAKVFECNTCH